MLKLLQDNWVVAQDVFKAYTCKNDDPFVISRAGFASFMTDCNLDLNRSSSDVLFYSATSDKLEAAEILKRFNHLIIKPSKHGMLRHQFLVGLLCLAGQQYNTSESPMSFLTHLCSAAKGR